MGIAIPKGGEMEFVIFDELLGLEAEPGWFQKLIIDGDLFDGFGGWYFLSPYGEYEVKTGDVFVRNRRGHIRYYKQAEFNDIYYVIE